MPDNHGPLRIAPRALVVDEVTFLGETGTVRLQSPVAIAREEATTGREFGGSAPAPTATDGSRFLVGLHATDPPLGSGDPSERDSLLGVSQPLERGVHTAVEIPMWYRNPFPVTDEGPTWTPIRPYRTGTAPTETVNSGSFFDTLGALGEDDAIDVAVTLWHDLSSPDGRQSGSITDVGGAAVGSDGALGPGGESTTPLDEADRPANDPPVVSLEVPPSLSPDEEATFTASATDPDGDSLSYAWRVGGESAGGDSATLDFTFADFGDAEVAVTVTDGQGASATASRVVTVGTPIETVADLRALADPTDGTFPLDGAYFLATDLALSDVADVRPIGGDTEPFTGSFDGRSSTITGLSVSRGTASNVGLFGVVGDGATVSSLTIAGGDVTGDESVGTLVGTNEGEVRDCAVNGGSVDGNTAVGGLVGTNDGGTVRGSESKGSDVTGQSGVGGVVGVNDGTVRGADPRVNDLTGSRSVGPLAGTNNGTVRDCSVINDIDPDATSLGGVVGTNTGSVADCSSRGSVSGIAAVGGLVGTNDGGTVEDSSTRMSATGQIRVGGAVGDNAAGTARRVEVKRGAEVDGSAANVGGFAGANGGEIHDSSADAEVTSGQSNTGGFVGVNRDGGTVTGSSASSLESIETQILAGGFVGTNAGEIRDSSTEILTKGGTSIGGFAGRNAESGTVKASTATGDVEDGRTQVGGFAGVNDGTVRGSTASGAVTGRSLTGGFAGDNGGEIRQSAATGDVTVRSSAVSSVGGLVGLNSGTVSETAANGTVFDERGISNLAFGGLVGTNTGEIRESAARGGVEGTLVSGIGTPGPDVGTKQVGGLVGKNGTSDNGGLVRNSYAVGGALGFDPVGALIGLNEGTARNLYADADSDELVGTNDGTLTTVTGLTPSEKMQGSSAATNMSALDFSGTWQTVRGDFPSIRALAD